MNHLTETLHSVKNKHKDTIQLIADILSFENPVEELKIKLSHNSIDWEQFVTIASQHLVLTTAYCRLQQKKLLEFIPLDLVKYLEEITEINRNRNISLLKQIQHIAECFNSNHINYVFLKGTALLTGAYYIDLGERMIGDIDILVYEEHLEKAYKLLLNENYQSVEQTLGDNYFEHKHLPRLTSKTHLSAVEIHRKVLSKPYKKALESNIILQQKRIIDANCYSIPSNQDLLIHSILNYQINDLGHYYTKISLRSIYDSLMLLRAQNSKSEMQLNWPYIKSYMSIANLFFKDFRGFKTNNFSVNLFQLKLDYPKLKMLIDGLLKKLLLFRIFIHRFFFLLINKNYRKAVFKDYKRIFSLIKSKF
ncbi:nucleotidyltransferase domain-containing protein [Psychroserpens sp. MEBiC05023]